MLTISGQSYDALAAAETADFTRRLRVALTERFPDRTGDFAGGRLDDMVAVAIAEGREYGIASEWNVGHYVMAMLLLGDHFAGDPALPWARRMLTDYDRTLDERTVLLVEAAAARAAAGGPARPA